MSAERRIDVVSAEGAWSGVDEHGVFVVTTPSRDETVELVGASGTSDLPVTLRIFGADGVIEGERTFPSSPSAACPASAASG